MGPAVHGARIERVCDSWEILRAVFFLAFLLLVVRSGAPSSVLAPSSAQCPEIL